MAVQYWGTRGIKDRFKGIFNEVIAIISAPITGIDSDGWKATYPTPPSEFSPQTAPEFFEVDRVGFNDSGTAITVTELVTLMKRVREPYSDQNTLTVSDVALSDDIYSTDTINNVTNNSVVVSNKPLCQWLRPDMDRATSGTYSPKLFVAHKHARDSRPVAAVKFSITDGTTTVTDTVSSMSTITYTASNKTVPHFTTTLDTSSLTPNVALTLDVIVYPWVGAAYQASVDGATYPSTNFTTMRVFNDVSYGTAYAYVGVGAGGGTVSETPATAQADPYPTVAAAANALKTYNNTNFSRNFSSGGVIRLEVGTHTHSGFNGATTDDLHLIVEAADVADKLTTIYQDAGSNTINSLPGRMLFRNLTLRQNGVGNTIFLDNVAGTNNDNRLILENVFIDRVTSGNFYEAWVYRVGRLFAIDCTVEGEPFKVFSTANKQAQAVGCSGALGSTYHNIGCHLTNSYGLSQYFNTDAGLEAPTMAVLAFNTYSVSSTSSKIVAVKDQTLADGIALIGNVIEDIDGTTSAAVDLWGDGDIKPQDNVVLQINTVVGERTNIMYQDTGTVRVDKRAYVQSCVFSRINTKSDTFAPESGNRIGNWPVIYKVGWRNNAYLQVANDNSADFGIGAWAGEVGALGDVMGTPSTPIDPDWINDASGDGSGLGGGDYRPGGSTELPFIPSGMAPYPVDQNGTTILNDGTSYIGALQP